MKEYLPEHYIRSKLNHPGSNYKKKSLAVLTVKHHLSIFRGWNLDKLSISMRLGWKILMLIKKKACMQVYKYASMQVCKYASMLVCNYTSMQIYNYASMQVCKYEHL